MRQADVPVNVNSYYSYMTRLSVFTGELRYIYIYIYMCVCVCMDVPVGILFRDHISMAGLLKSIEHRVNPVIGHLINPNYFQPLIMFVVEKKEPIICIWAKWCAKYLSIYFACSRCDAFVLERCPAYLH